MNRPMSTGVKVLGAVAIFVAACQGLLCADETPEVEVSTREAFKYEASGLRDPFVPLVRDGRIIGVSFSQKNSSPTPVLLGVLWDPNGNSIALMANGEVRVGETIGAYKVKAISKDSVTLTSDESEVVLKVVSENNTTDGADESLRGGDAL